MAFVGGASIGARSFAGNAVSVRRARTTSYRTITMVKSKAIPFLEAPAALNGTMVGDVGFDPLYLSDTINIDYARAAVRKPTLFLLSTINTYFSRMTSAVFTFRAVLRVCTCRTLLYISLYPKGNQARKNLYARSPRLCRTGVCPPPG